MQGRGIVKQSMIEARSRQRGLRVRGARGAALVLGVAIGAVGGGCGGSRAPAGPQDQRGPAAPAEQACAAAPFAKLEGANAHRCDCGDEATCVAKCNGGSASDCYALGGCYTGLGFDRDPAKFFTYSARGCELGSPSACTNLAKAYASGVGVAPDPARAEQLFASAADSHRTGCQSGVANDCYMLGYAYEHGEGVKADPVMAGSLKQRACMLGHPASCLLLAVDARSSGSPDQAARWFGVACETTCSAGCDEVRGAVAQGVPAALQVVEQWKQRCGQGQQAACRAQRSVEPGQRGSR